MKRITLFALLTSVSMVLFAQATDLVVDNQNPGWLSNVISFDDQKTVKNLKVTGYINETDLQFIGTLMARELDGRLDLSEVNVVDVSGKDNYLGANMFGLSSNESVQHLILPTSCTELNKCLGDYLTVDTLDINCHTPQLKKTMLGKCPYNIIVGDNVDSLISVETYRGAFESCTDLKSIVLPSSLKYIGWGAFLRCSNLKYINYEDFYQSLEGLEENALRCDWHPDTIVSPTKVEKFCLSAFNCHKNMHFFISNNVKEISVYYGQYGSGLSSDEAGDIINQSQTIYIHSKCVNPPSVTAKYNYWNKSAIVYVPKGAKDAYLKNDYWKEGTIIEENPLETILLDQHTASMEIGETLRLIPTFIPSDADDRTLTWSVKDEGVAKVENGVVTALAPGKTWVYAKSVVEDVMDSCEVTVIQHVTDIALDTPAVTLEGIGATVQLNVIVTPEDATDKSVTWSSSNPSVCVVSNGKIVAVGYGTSVVIATSVDGGHMAVATVKVNEAGFVTLSIQQSANGAVSTQVEKGSVQTFAIQAESGWKIHSVTFNDADVTSELDATNHYTTPTITENSTLFVTFEEDTATDVKATDASDVRVQGTSFGVRILNATNETANIYTPDGVLVKTVKVTGAKMDVDLPEGGIYLVKVADKAVKVSR